MQKHFLNLKIFVWLCGLICFFHASPAAGQSKSMVRFIIVEDDTRKVTPAMVCITDENHIPYLPPDGKVDPTPTFPDISFKGVAFSSNKNWIGPVRKMKGAGAVNGQRTYVYGSNPSLPYWTDSVMYQVSGDFTIALPKGKWWIQVQHGNEYIPVRLSFTVSESKNSITHKLVLRRWINLPHRGWYSGDVHTHHQWSKPAFINYMLALGKAEDVHLLNVLEMGDRRRTEFTPDGFGAKHRICRDGICLVPGQEDPRSDFGHVIALNIDSLSRDTAHYNYYDLVLNNIHRHPGALAGFAHFAYSGEGVTKGMALYAPLASLDFVEILQNTQLNTKDYYKYLNMGFKFSVAAGSDFPWGSTVGDGRTFVYTGNPFSVDAWFSALKAGHSFVSNGPALFLEVNGEIPGSTIYTGKASSVWIHGKAISNSAIGKIDLLEIYNNDGLVISCKNSNDADSIELDFRAVIKKSQWFVAVTHCSNGALAHTSPVYCMVDGEPLIDTEKAPALLQKQLDIISDMRKDELAKPLPDKGLLERMNAAEEYYKQMADNLISR